MIERDHRIVSRLLASRPPLTFDPETGTVEQWRSHWQTLTPEQRAAEQVMWSWRVAQLFSKQAEKGQRNEARRFAKDRYATAYKAFDDGLSKAEAVERLKVELAKVDQQVNSCTE
jgi:hypothetical protein